MPQFVMLKNLLHKGQKQKQEKKELQRVETPAPPSTIAQLPPMLDVPLPPELEASRAIPLCETAPSSAQPLPPSDPLVMPPQVGPQPNMEQAPPPASVQASQLLDSQALPQSNSPRAVPVAVPDANPSPLQTPVQSPPRIALRGPGEFTIIEENGAYHLTFNAALDRATVQSLLGIPATSAANTETAGEVNDSLQGLGRGDLLHPNSAQPSGKVIYHNYRRSQQNHTGEKTVEEDRHKPANAAARTFSPDNDSVVDSVEANGSAQGAPHLEMAQPHASNKNKGPAKRGPESVEKFTDIIGGPSNAGHGKARVIKGMRKRDERERRHGDPALGLPGAMQNGLVLNPPNGHNQHGPPHGAGPAERPVYNGVMAALNQPPARRSKPIIDPRFLGMANNPPGERRLAAIAAVPNLPPSGSPAEKPVPDGAESTLKLADWPFLNRRGAGIELNKGSQGDVEVVKHQKTGKLFVVKKECFAPLPLTRDPATTTYGRELAVLIRLRHFNHPNIIKYYFYAEDRTLPSGAGACLVLEYCTGGDLAKLIEHFKDTLQTLTPRLFIYHFIASMADALAYLHCGLPPSEDDSDMPAEAAPGWEPIIHADIKPENIFIRWNEAAPGRLPDIVLGDFGISGTQKSQISNWGGTNGFIAPELEREAIFTSCSEMLTGKTLITMASDIYAFGATLYQVVTHGPYQSWLGTKADIGMEYARVIMAPLTQGDDHLMLLTRFCLAELPQMRYSTLELYAHGQCLKSFYGEVSQSDKESGLTGPDQWHAEAHDRGRPRERDGGRRDPQTHQTPSNSSEDLYSSSIPPARQRGTARDPPIRNEAVNKVEVRAGPVYPVAARGKTQIKLTDYLRRRSITFRPCDCLKAVTAFRHPWHPQRCPPRDRHEKRLRENRQITSATLAQWDAIYGPSTMMLEGQKRQEEQKRQERQKSTETSSGNGGVKI